MSSMSHLEPMLSSFRGALPPEYLDNGIYDLAICGIGHLQYMATSQCIISKQDDDDDGGLLYTTTASGSHPLSSIESAGVAFYDHQDDVRKNSKSQPRYDYGSYGSILQCNRRLVLHKNNNKAALFNESISLKEAF